MDQEKKTISCQPSYDRMLPIWTQLYITTELGQTGVKNAGETYLPKTEGQVEDGNDGTVRYDAYKKRATYYNFCSKTIKKAMGLMHSKTGVIQLPEKLDKWIESITIDGEDIYSLSRDINSQQLLYGRIGLLLDYSEKGQFPHVVKYSADSILVWNEIVVNGSKKLQFVLLDESGDVFNSESKTFEKKDQFRLLALGRGEIFEYYYSVLLDERTWITWDIDSPDQSHEEFRIFKNPKTIDYIPFTVANIKTTTMEIEKPLLVELSDLSLSAYRADAEYRQGLYLQAFALLFLIGFSTKKMENTKVRSDGFIHSDNKDAKVGYANASADGLGEMRLSLEALKRESEGNGIVISDKEGVESGKALTTRITLQTSDLRELALTSAEAINKLLKWGLEWMGSPNICKYTPNLDFNQEKLSPRDYLDLWNVAVGGGISLKNVYRWALRNDMAIEDTYEDWLVDIQESLSILGFSFGGAEYDKGEGNEADDNSNEE